MSTTRTHPGPGEIYRYDQLTCRRAQLSSNIACWNSQGDTVDLPRAFGPALASYVLPSVLNETALLSHMGHSGSATALLCQASPRLHSAPACRMAHVMERAWSLVFNCSDMSMEKGCRECEKKGWKGCEPDACQCTEP